MTLSRDMNEVMVQGGSGRSWSKSSGNISIKALGT